MPTPREWHERAAAILAREQAIKPRIPVPCWCSPERPHPRSVIGGGAHWVATSEPGVTRRPALGAERRADR